MKILLLMRHATAAEKLLGQSDQDRELTLYGERQAGEAGVWLMSQQLVPQLVMCSPSVRTSATCQSVQEGLGKKVPVQMEKVIYSGSEKDLYHLIQEEAGDDVEILMVLGHNPSISTFASQMANEEIVFYPANVAVVQFNVTQWEEVRLGNGKLVNYYRG